MSQPIDWAEQILALARERNMSLRELAADLGVSHVYLGNVVRGQRAASAKLKIKIWGRQKYDLTREQMLELLLPDDIADEFHAFEIERGKARAQKAIAKSAKKTPEPKPSTEGDE
ncbi:helix-turn-helix domain-containing protein [Aquabacterium commune]|nr:helix-turn-helix transcriptional regulator [Aquabacterium commune]